MHYIDLHRHANVIDAEERDRDGLRHLLDACYDAVTDFRRVQAKARDDAEEDDRAGEAETRRPVPRGRRRRSRENQRFHAVFERHHPRTVLDDGHGEWFFGGWGCIDDGTRACDAYDPFATFAVSACTTTGGQAALYPIAPHGSVDANARDATHCTCLRYADLKHAYDIKNQISASRLHAESEQRDYPPVTDDALRVLADTRAQPESCELSSPEREALKASEDAARREDFENEVRVTAATENARRVFDAVDAEMRAADDEREPRGEEDSSATHHLVDGRTD